MMQNNDSKPNTLAAHNVQVGDVVQYHSPAPGCFHTVGCTAPYETNSGVPMSSSPCWTVISRAKPKPKVDTQFGDWEIWNGKGDLPTGLVQAHWQHQDRKEAERNAPNYAGIHSWGYIIAFRRVIEPVRGEVVLTGNQGRIGWIFSSQDYDGLNTHSVTLPTIEGKLILGKYTGPDGAVVTVEVSG